MSLSFPSKSDSEIPLFLDENDFSFSVESNSCSRKDAKTDEKEDLQSLRFNVSQDDDALYEDTDEFGGFVGKSGVQHAVFARDLDPEIFKIQLHQSQLRNFHRPKVSLVDSPISVKLTSQDRYLRHVAQNGKKYVPRKPRDLQLRDGDFLLCEFLVLVFRFLFPNFFRKKILL